MKRIDTPGNVNGQFSEGQPFASSGAIPATIVSAAWLNAIQEEAIYPIEAEGLTLDPSDSTQLFQALELMFERIVGWRFSFTATEDLTAGDGFLVRDVFVVVEVDVLNTATAVGFYRGRHSLPKIAAENHTKGDELFWDQSLRELSTDSDGGARPSVGFADSNAAPATTTVFCRLSGPPNS